MNYLVKELLVLTLISVNVSASSPEADACKSRRDMLTISFDVNGQLWRKTIKFESAGGLMVDPAWSELWYEAGGVRLDNASFKMHSLGSGVTNDCNDVHGNAITLPNSAWCQDQTSRLLADMSLFWAKSKGKIKKTEEDAIACAINRITDFLDRIKHAQDLARSKGKSSQEEAPHHSH